MRVPLIFRAPGRFAPRRTPCLASLLDLLPTLLDLGRPAAGETADIGHDGASLAPLLEGGELPERTVLGEYLAEGALAPIFMIRRGPWKFIWSEPDPPLLFDLARDGDELQNLAASPEHAPTARASRPRCTALGTFAPARRDPQEPAGAPLRLAGAVARPADALGLPAAPPRPARCRRPPGPQRPGAPAPLPAAGWLGFPT